MANIIDTTFFDGGELNIPNTDQLAISEKIDDFIVKYEPDFLQKAFGYPLWKLFKADAYPVPVTPRFVALLNGNVEFTDKNNHTKLWIGLNTVGQSAIADYIWYWYQRDNVSYNSSQGEVKGRAENSRSVNISIKMMRVWNEMHDILCLLWEFLECATTDGAPTYPEFDICQVHRFGRMTYI